MRGLSDRTISPVLAAEIPEFRSERRACACVATTDCARRSIEDLCDLCLGEPLPMNQTDDFLIQWIECGKSVVKMLDGAVLVSNAISLFEFLLQPGHQCAAASRTAPLAC